MVNSNFILHTYRHMRRHRRHLHQKSFWSAGGLSCRKLSNKGINKAWTKCSSSKVTGSGCTPKEARPSADLCQWSHHVQPNTLLKYAGTDIATKNLQEKQGSKRNHEKAAFLQLKEKKKNTLLKDIPYSSIATVWNFKRKTRQSFPNSESVCLVSKFINTDWFTLTACPETPVITSYIS